MEIALKKDKLVLTDLSKLINNGLFMVCYQTNISTQIPFFGGSAQLKYGIGQKLVSW